jgi:hypothetical protein
MVMRPVAFVFFFLLNTLFLKAQKGYNIYVTATPTVTFGTTFTNGSRQYISPDNQTGVNTIYPLYSVLDGYPNPKRSVIQNLARKFTWGVLIEKNTSENNSINAGFEIGARGYKMKSERSVSSLISYRNLAVPIYFSHYKWLGQFWTLKFNYGGSLNYSFSIPESTNIVEIKRYPIFYPLLGGGTEMAYMGKEGRLSFEAAYYQGWQNILNHTYIGVDNRSGQRVYATGSHLRLTLKYNFKRLREKEKKPAAPGEAPEEIPGYFFDGRLLKAPQKFDVKNETIRLCFRDDRTVDGDSVVVLWNDKVVASGLALKKKPECIDLRLDTGNNVLVVHAINEGRIKPNTYQIKILDGKEEKVFSMKSDMQQSATAIFRRE